MYNLAMPTAWILFPSLGTALLTVWRSASERIEGIVAVAEDDQRVLRRQGSIWLLKNDMPVRTLA